MRSLLLVLSGSCRHGTRLDDEGGWFTFVGTTCYFVMLVLWGELSECVCEQIFMDLPRPGRRPSQEPISLRIGVGRLMRCRHEEQETENQLPQTETPV
jgi:hypothetical protein